MPPTDEQENFPAILDRGDRCELNYDDAWWECTVLSVHPDPDGGETEFVLRPTQYSEKHRVGEDRVRLFYFILFVNFNLPADEFVFIYV